MPASSLRLGLALSVVAVLLSVAPVAADPPFAEWSAPLNLGPVVNSSSGDLGPAISPDGRALYFTSTRPGGQGSEDIWVARRASEAHSWGLPVNLGAPVNSASNERVPAFSSDGRTLFFASDRPAGFGQRDIWMSQRRDPADDFGWGPVVNLGANVNTVADEAGMALFEEGGDEGHAVLIFNSTRPGGQGDQDMYVSVRAEDGSFGPATPVAELNTAGVDARPTIRRDGREIFFFRGPSAAGPFELWGATRQHPRTPWSAPLNLGAVVNSTANDLQPSLSRDGSTLFFASNRPGGSGLADLWKTTRESGQP